VIIRTKPGAQAHVARKLHARGEQVDKHHKLVPALSARVGRQVLAELAADPNVESISSDADVTADSRRPKNGGLPVVPSVQKLLGVSGWFSTSTTGVAVIDSGIAPSPDFADRIVGFYDFTGGDGAIATAPTDEYGHGTHVAGLIASNGRTSNGAYVGVAPGVKLLGLKVLDKKGVGRTSHVLSALEFVVANKHRFNIKVVNLSLGHPVYEPAATDPLVIAVENVVRAGIVVVVSAGNNGTNPYTGVTGYGGITSPGNAPSAITVGSANTNDTIARTDDAVTGYSSRGPSWYDGIAKPDLVAPGHNLISTAPYVSTLGTEYPSLLLQNGSAKFLKLNGASMATAVVSGAVAQMIDAHAYGAWARWNATDGPKTPYVAPPALTTNALKAMLQFSATPLRKADGTAYDYLTQGTGLVNGVGAVTLAYFADTSQAAGAYWAASTVQPTTRFDHVEQAWSQALIWGTRLLEGSSLVEVHQFAFGENIVWGTGEYDLVWGTMDDSENIVWGSSLGAGLDLTWAGNVQLGENIVWGTFNWEENIVWGTSLLGYFDGFNIVWGTFNWNENIVWGTLDDENIVWGTSEKKVTVLGSGGVL
jgi:serine protease AprX